MKLLLHEYQEVIAKIELDITSELANLNIHDTVQKRKELYAINKNYEKVLERQTKEMEKGERKRETEDNSGPR